MHDSIDVHNHIVPENFPPYVGKGRDVPWPSMAPAHACHRHVMISGKVYRTVSDGSWSVPRRIEDMGAMRVTKQAISPMPELLSYWLPLDDAKVMCPLPQRRRSRAMIAAGAAALHRPGRRAAAGRRRRHPRARVRVKSLKFAGVRDRQPRERHLHRRPALRAVLRRGREDGRGDLRARAAPGGPGPHRRPVHRAGGVLPRRHRPRLRLDDHRRHRACATRSCASPSATAAA